MSIAPAAVFGMHMDCIEPDVITVQNSQAGGHNLPAVQDGGTDRLFGDCPIHGRYYQLMHDIGGALQSKETVNPFGRYKTADCDRMCDSSGGEVIKVHRHDIGGMLDYIPTLLQHIIECAGYQGADFKDSRSSPLAVYGFAVIDFLIEGDGGFTDLFHAVGAVGIKI